MVTPKVQPPATPGEWIVRLVAHLVVGDLLDSEFLPFFCEDGLHAEVLYLRPFTHKDEARVFVAFAQPDGYHDSMTLLADAEVRVIPGRGDDELTRLRAEVAELRAARTCIVTGCTRDAGHLGEHNFGQKQVQPSGDPGRGAPFDEPVGHVPHSAACGRAWGHECVCGAS